MSNDFKYKTLFVRNGDTALNFFIHQLGFMYHEKIEIDGQFYPLVKDANDRVMALVESKVQTNVNILPTDDCLRDYYNFKRRNLHIMGTPRYQSGGLAIDLNDPAGTSFLLLEERDYSDD